MTDNPHEVDENPEDHIGEELPDPWEDDSAGDWPNETTEAE